MINLILKIYIHKNSFESKSTPGIEVCGENEAYSRMMNLWYFYLESIINALRVHLSFSHRNKRASISFPNHILVDINFDLGRDHTYFPYFSFTSWVVLKMEQKSDRFSLDKYHGTIYTKKNKKISRNCFISASRGKQSSSNTWIFCLEISA